MHKELKKLAEALANDSNIEQILINSCLYDKYVEFDKWLHDMSHDDLVTFALCILESENYWGE